MDKLKYTKEIIQEAIEGGFDFVSFTGMCNEGVSVDIKNIDVFSYEDGFLKMFVDIGEDIPYYFECGERHLFLNKDFALCFYGDKYEYKYHLVRSVLSDDIFDYVVNYL